MISRYWSVWESFECYEVVRNTVICLVLTMISWLSFFRAKSSAVFPSCLCIWNYLKLTHSFENGNYIAMHAGSKHGRIVRTLSCVSSRISGCESNNFRMTWLPLNATDMSGVQPKPPYREKGKLQCSCSVAKIRRYRLMSFHHNDRRKPLRRHWHLHLSGATPLHIPFCRFARPMIRENGHAKTLQE